MEYKAIPLGERILIKKDDDQEQTRGGIILPDQSKIPRMTGRVIEIAHSIEIDGMIQIKKMDKVLVSPQSATPVSFAPDNKQFIVHIDDVIAVLEKIEKE